MSVLQKEPIETTKQGYASDEREWDENGMSGLSVLEEELTEKTGVRDYGTMSAQKRDQRWTEDKMRRLVSLFSNKNLDEIDMSFDIRKDVNVEHNYFYEMMASAISYHFKVETDPETVETFSTLRDIVDYVNSRQ